MIPFAGSCVFMQFSFLRFSLLCVKDFVLAASYSTVMYICISVDKGTVPENDLREQGLGSAVIKLVCASVPRYGYHGTCIDRFLISVKCAQE
jgi:hypothetical protein